LCLLSVLVLLIVVLVPVLVVILVLLIVVLIPVLAVVLLLIVILVVLLVSVLIVLILIHDRILLHLLFGYRGIIIAVISAFILWLEENSGKQSEEYGGSDTTGAGFQPAG